MSICTESGIYSAFRLMFLESSFSLATFPIATLANCKDMERRDIIEQDIAFAT